MYLAASPPYLFQRAHRCTLSRALFSEPNSAASDSCCMKYVSHLWDDVWGVRSSVLLCYDPHQLLSRSRHALYLHEISTHLRISMLSSRRSLCDWLSIYYSTSCERLNIDLASALLYLDEAFSSTALSVRCRILMVLLSCCNALIEDEEYVLFQIRRISYSGEMYFKTS